MDKLKLLVLFCVSAAVAAGVAEVALHFVYQPADAYIDAFQLSESSYYQRDKEIGWVPRAHVRGVHEERGKFVSLFSTNSLGLRGPEYPVQKPEGVARVLVLGDSFAWGFGVSDGELFPHILDDALPNVEVINLGVTAYSIKHARRYFDRVGVQHDPDIVVLALVQNDAWQSLRPLVPSDLNEAAEQAVPTVPESRFVRLRQFLGGNVRLYALVRDAFNQSRPLVNVAVRLGLKGELSGFDALDPNLMPALLFYPDTLRVAWDSTLAQVREMKARMDELDVRFILALVPARQAVEPAHLRNSLAYSRYWIDDFDTSKPYAELATFARSEGIEVVNPLERFRREARAGRELYLPRDMHFSPAGHQVFAEEIAERITHPAGSP